MITITLTDEQEQKFNDWKKEVGYGEHLGATGGNFSIEVIFTSIGRVIYGKRYDGIYIDLTDDNF